jgi:hypothetical protein
MNRFTKENFIGRIWRKQVNITDLQVDGGNYSLEGRVKKYDEMSEKKFDKISSMVDPDDNWEYISTKERIKEIRDEGVIFRNFQEKL